MRVAIITIAGISSRFNEGIPEDGKVLKAIYSNNGVKSTLLYYLLKKCAYADRIILVGGYKFHELYEYYVRNLADEFRNVELVQNGHFEDLASGYSLYLGIKAAMGHKPDEVLFVEGDLDIDMMSFASVVESGRSVLTYTTEPIYANKAVVLYQDRNGCYKYAFNSSHGLLNINEPFACILNSGQTWKFTDTEALKQANDEFFKYEKDDTNLKIIQRYIDSKKTDELELICLKRWTNCNTREDYRKIKKYWEAES